MHGGVQRPLKCLAYVHLREDGLVLGWIAFILVVILPMLAHAAVSVTLQWDYTQNPAAPAVTFQVASQPSCAGATSTLTIPAIYATGTFKQSVTVPTPFMGTALTVPRSQMSVIFRDSEDVLNGHQALKLIDGDASTYWCTQWQGGSPPHPHEVQLDLGTTYQVSGFTYLPRQDSIANGTIQNYAVYVSINPMSWGTPVAAGVLVAVASDKTVKTVTFNPKTGRYLRLVAMSSANPNEPWTTGAEITVQYSITEKECFVVTALDAAGNISATSNPVNFQCVTLGPAMVTCGSQ